MVVTDKYLETLLSYYEAEIMGEAYFYGLVEYFEEPEKLALLAKVERKAAEAVVPLLRKYKLLPRCETELKAVGEGYVERHEAISWPDFMAYIVHRYPLYLDEFRGLRKMAPEEDYHELDILTEHEVAAIDFARKELAGDPDSVAPLHQYLQR